MKRNDLSAIKFLTSPNGHPHNSMENKLHRREKKEFTYRKEPKEPTEGQE